MQCQCGVTAQYVLGRDGKPAYTCANSRCKFWAVGPTTSEGYSRLSLTTSSPPAGTTIVRFEALLHPVQSGVPAVMAMVEGNVYPHHPVRRVLEDPVYEGKWFPSRKAYVFTLPHYAPLLTRLQRLSLEHHHHQPPPAPQRDTGSSVSLSRPPPLHLLIEPIPNFFFKCLDQGNQLARQFADCLPDEQDIVFQQLQSFQRKGVEFILRHGGRGMIADEMGLGKTVQAIAVAHFYRHEWPLLVVCPMSLMENWAKEISRFCSIPFSRIGLVQGRKTAVVPDIQDVIITSYTSLPALVAAATSTSGSPVSPAAPTTTPYRVVICDESHYIKGADTKRTRSALEVCKNAARVVLLSGTPALSRPIELYTQLRAIAPAPPAPSILPSSTQFSARYCNAHVQSRGGTFTVNTEGHSHMDELHLLLQHFMIRRSKSELGNALPSKSRQLLYVTVQEKEKAMMAKQVSSLRKTVIHNHASARQSGSNTGGASAYEEVGEILTHRTPNAFELKIATAQAKIPAVTDYIISTIEKHQASKSKMIVFAHHQCMMDALKAAADRAGPANHPIDYIVISGDTPANQRESLAEHFRTEPTCLVAILSMQSSGVGHNFTCASTVIFAELDWNPSTHLQCEDRVHRIGQSKPCVIQYLLAEGTSDAVIWPLLNAKLSVTTAMLGGAEATSAPYPSSPDSQKALRKSAGGTSGGGSAPAPSSSSSSSSGVTLEGEGAEKLFVGRRDGGSQSQRTLDAFLSTPTAEQGSSNATAPGKDPHHQESTLDSVRKEAESKEKTSPLSDKTDASPLLCPLMSFDEIAVMDPIWRETAHSRPIPGVPPLPKSFSSSSPSPISTTAVSPPLPQPPQPQQQKQQQLNFSLDAASKESGLRDSANRSVCEANAAVIPQQELQQSPNQPLPNPSPTAAVISAPSGQAPVSAVPIVPSGSRRTLLSWSSVNTAVAQAASSASLTPPAAAAVSRTPVANPPRRRTTFTFQQQQHQYEAKQNEEGTGSSVGNNNAANTPPASNLAGVTPLETATNDADCEEERANASMRSSISPSIALGSMAVHCGGAEGGMTSFAPHTKRPRSSSEFEKQGAEDAGLQSRRSAHRAEHPHSSIERNGGSAPSRSFAVHFSPSELTMKPPTGICNELPPSEPPAATATLDTANSVNTTRMATIDTATVAVTSDNGSGEAQGLAGPLAASSSACFPPSSDKESHPATMTSSSDRSQHDLPSAVVVAEGGTTLPPRTISSLGVAALAPVAVVTEDILLPAVIASTTPCRRRTSLVKQHAPPAAGAGATAAVSSLCTRTMMKIGSEPPPPPPAAAATAATVGAPEPTLETGARGRPFPSSRGDDAAAPSLGLVQSAPAVAHHSPALPTPMRRTIVSFGAPSPSPAVTTTTGIPPRMGSSSSVPYSPSPSTEGTRVENQDGGGRACDPRRHTSNTAEAAEVPDATLRDCSSLQTPFRATELTGMHSVCAAAPTMKHVDPEADGLGGRPPLVARPSRLANFSGSGVVEERPVSSISRSTRTIVPLPPAPAPPPAPPPCSPSPPSCPSSYSPFSSPPSMVSHHHHHHHHPVSTMSTTPSCRSLQSAAEIPLVPVPAPPPPTPLSPSLLPVCFSSSPSPAPVHSTPPSGHALLSGETLLQTVTRQASATKTSTARSTRKTFIIQKPTSSS